METAIYILIGIVIGCVSSFIVEKTLFRTHVSGNLRVDHSIPEDDPYIFLELTESVGSVLKRKQVTLNVKAEDFIPHD